MTSRYSRQEILIGEAGQQKLRNSTVLIVGVGALGTVASEILARAGIGKLILIDNDFVSLPNIQRQHLFDEADVEKLKVEVAKLKLQKINSEVKISIFNDRLTKNFQIPKCDIVLDCTDNLNSRNIINELCFNHNLIWVHGGAVKTHGEIYITNPSDKTRACFSCIYTSDKVDTPCSENGVLGSITSIIGSIQAQEAINILLGKDFVKDLFRIDVVNHNFLNIKVNKNKNCSVCK